MKTCHVLLFYVRYVYNTRRRLSVSSHRHETASGWSGPLGYLILLCAPRHRRAGCHNEAPLPKQKSIESLYSQVVKFLALRRGTSSPRLPTPQERVLKRRLQVHFRINLMITHTLLWLALFTEFFNCLAAH